MKDYYQILGISKSASNEEIRKAFKQLSVKYHPDKNNGQVLYSDLFKSINEAHQVLSNTFKKKEYDFLLSNYNVKKWLKESEIYARSQEEDEWFKKRRRKIRLKNFIGLTAALSFILFMLIMTYKIDYSNSHRFAASDAETEAITDPPIGEPEIQPVKSGELEVMDAAVHQPSSLIKNEVKQPRKELIRKKKRTKPNKEKEHPPIIASKIAGIKPEPKPALTPPAPIAEKHLTEREMNKILNQIYSKRKTAGSEIKCVRIVKTESSNLKNAFAITDFLQQRGFTIAGRKLNKENINGIKVDIVDNCILLTMGSI